MPNTQVKQIIEKHIAEIAILQQVLNDNPDYFPPTIPDEVFLNLPAPIAEAVNQYDTLEEKSIALLSTITASASGLNGIRFPLRHNDYYLNLYLIIIGPPASNKSIALHARKILEKISIRNESNYKANKTRYKEFLKQKQHAKKTATNNPTIDDSSLNYRDLEIEATEPKPKYAILPGDISSSALINLIDKNDGNGIIFDSEAQTILNAFKQEWGSNVATVLLKSFGNEPVELMRASLDSMISIPKPKLSVLLTGNPEHLNGLVKTITNGLYSRFCVFRTQKTSWKDVNPEENAKNYLNGYVRLSVLVDEISLKLESDLSVEFQLSLDQIDHYNHFFRTLNEMLSEHIDKDFSSIVMRMAVVFYRICAVLTAIRNENNLTAKLVCSNDDFQNAIHVCATLLKHSVFTFLTTEVQKDSIDNLLDELPDVFNRKQAIAVAIKLKISPRTMDNYIKSLIGKKIEKVKHGEFKKKVPAILQNMQYSVNEDSLIPERFEVAEILEEQSKVVDSFLGLEMQNSNPSLLDDLISKSEYKDDSNFIDAIYDFKCYGLDAVDAGDVYLHNLLTDLPYYLQITPKQVYSIVSIFEDLDFIKVDENGWITRK
jgi:hypothetical protein